MNFTEQEISQITRYVFNKIKVESSSDFIEILYEIYSRVSKDKIIDLSPVREIEKDNWRIGIANVEHIKSKLAVFEYADLVDAELAYKYIINVLLVNKTISKIYKLDENDKIGWLLFKELGEKWDFVKRLMCINQTTENS
jgi:hypothetical protein